MCAIHSRLEQHLSYRYCALTKGGRKCVYLLFTDGLSVSGDTIALKVDMATYQLKVLDAKPTDSVWIVETELELDLVPSDALPKIVSYSCSAHSMN